MKKFITFFSVLIFLTSFNLNTSYSQPNNVLLEYCTGAWCGYCPCGHDIIHDILMNYPNTTVLAYHGYTAANDPWYSYSAGIRTLFGFSGYPTAVIGRKSGIISRNGWNNEVVLQSLLIQPQVSIQVTNKVYDAGSRTVTATVTLTANADLTGDYYVNYVLTENNLVYTQIYYADCGVAGPHHDYVHNHVVKSMMNGDLGEMIHTGSWSAGHQVVRNLTYVLPASPQVMEPNNCDINIFVYKQGTSISTNYNVQQSMKTPVTGTTGISNNSITPVSYSLTQNYPNPFNPNTNFSFSIPKNGNVTLKFYNILGTEIETYVDGFLNAGTYGVEFDGSKYSSGIYFYTLTSGDFTETKKMNLIK